LRDAVVNRNVTCAKVIYDRLRDRCEFGFKRVFVRSRYRLYATLALTVNYAGNDIVKTPELF